MLRVPPALWATISKTEILLSKNTFAFLHDHDPLQTSKHRFFSSASLCNSAFDELRVELCARQMLLSDRKNALHSP
jgi:hypothetical protein